MAEDRGGMTNKWSFSSRIWVLFWIFVIILTFLSKSFYNYRLPVVSVCTVKSGELDFSVKGTGQIEYADIHRYYAECDGVVRRIFVSEGSAVKTGETIMLIDSLDSKKEYKLTAKRGGIVTNLPVEKGMYVSYMSNMILCEVAEQLDEWQVVLTLSEKEAGSLQKGDAASITLVNGNRQWEGKIGALHPYSGESGPGYRVVIDFQTGNLLQSEKSKDSGSAGEFDSTGDSDNTGDFSIAWRMAEVVIPEYTEIYDTILPLDAVKEDSHGYFVYVLREDDTVLGAGYQAQRISVDLVDSDLSYCAVEGIPMDEKIIEKASSDLRNGEAVYLEDL